MHGTARSLDQPTHLYFFVARPRPAIFARQIRSRLQRLELVDQFPFTILSLFESSSQAGVLAL